MEEEAQGCLVQTLISKNASYEQVYHILCNLTDSEYRQDNLVTGEPSRLRQSLQILRPLYERGQLPLLLKAVIEDNYKEDEYYLEYDFKITEVEDYLVIALMTVA